MLLSPRSDHRSVGAELVLHLDHLAGAVGVEDLHHVEGVVSGSPAPRTPAYRHRDRGRHPAQLPAGGHDVDGSVVVTPDEHPEGGGVAGRASRPPRREPRCAASRRAGRPASFSFWPVARASPGSRRFSSRPWTWRGVGQTASQRAHLFLEEGDLRLQLVDLLLALLRLLAAIRHPFSPPTRVIDGTGGILALQRALSVDTAARRTRPMPGTGYFLVLSSGPTRARVRKPV